MDRTGVGNVTIDFQTFLRLLTQRRGGPAGEVATAAGGHVTRRRRIFAPYSTERRAFSIAAASIAREATEAVFVPERRAF